MMTYQMSLDGGAGGTDEVSADSLAEAMSAALEWAEGGDWSIAQEGTEDVYGGAAAVHVRVWREDEDGRMIEEETGTYEIPTLGDLKEETMEDGDVLAEREHEYSTESIVRVGEDIYLRHKNGGARGSWDRQGGDGVWRERPVEPARLLTTTEARERLLDWGYAPAEIADMTEEGCAR